VKLTLLRYFCPLLNIGTLSLNLNKYLLYSYLITMILWPCPCCLFPNL